MQPSTKLFRHKAHTLYSFRLQGGGRIWFYHNNDWPLAFTVTWINWTIGISAMRLQKLLFAVSI